MATALEFWPEYNGGPLWTQDGKTADLSTLELSPELRNRLTGWNSKYEDSKLPFEANDSEWLDEGTTLLHDVRSELGSAYEIVVTEPWWGEEPGG